jgi:site-specific recombinase XerD
LVTVRRAVSTQSSHLFPFTPLCSALASKLFPNKKPAEYGLFQNLATHLLNAGADLSFVKDWLGHANIQNTTIYAQLTNPAQDQQARKLVASHRVV